MKYLPYGIKSALRTVDKLLLFSRSTVESMNIIKASANLLAGLCILSPVVS